MSLLHTGLVVCAVALSLWTPLRAAADTALENPPFSAVVAPLARRIQRPLAWVRRAPDGRSPAYASAPSLVPQRPLSTSQLVYRVLQASEAQRSVRRLRSSPGLALGIRAIASSAPRPRGRAGGQARDSAIFAFAGERARTRPRASAPQLARRVEGVLRTAQDLERSPLRFGLFLDRRMRRARADARERWLDVIGSMLADPALHDAVLEELGERRFLYAKQYIERVLAGGQPTRS